jgi:hypothetical protein
LRELIPTRRFLKESARDKNTKFPLWNFLYRAIYRASYAAGKLTDPDKCESGLTANLDSVGDDHAKIFNNDKVPTRFAALDALLRISPRDLLALSAKERNAWLKVVVPIWERSVCDPSIPDPESSLVLSILIGWLGGHVSYDSFTCDGMSE